jgi:monofunctional biosynthetic peptidoglycan transglycosylase
LWRLGAIVFILLVPAPIAVLLIFRFLPVPGTPEMLVSLVQGKGASYAWSDDISPRLERAVIAAEDQNFCTHHGFDLASINKAMEDHKRHQHHLPTGRAQHVPGADAQLDPQGA